MVIKHAITLIVRTAQSCLYFKCLTMVKKNEAAKIALLLKKILEEKTVLFAAFSDKITKETKSSKWKNVAELAKSLCLIPLEKDFTYVRDTLWPNIRNSTTKKIDNAKKTGTGGGPEAKLTVIDNLVIDILGKDSPGVMGLGIKDPLAEPIELENVISASVCDEILNFISAPVGDENHTVIEPSLQLQCSITDDNSACNHELARKSSVKICHKNSKRHKEVEEEEILKRRKLELQIDQLNLQNYKLKLEILEKEKLLNVCRSKYTAEVQENSL